jgi:hypothetical protein
LSRSMRFKFANLISIFFVLTLRPFESLGSSERPDKRLGHAPSGKFGTGRHIVSPAISRAQRQCGNYGCAPGALTRFRLAGYHPASFRWHGITACRHPVH